MTVQNKVKELLEKEYRMDFWDCYNDDSNTDEWMLGQAVDNSLIVVEEVLEVLSSLCSAFAENNYEAFVAVNQKRNFYEEVKKQLLKNKPHLP